MDALDVVKPVGWHHLVVEPRRPEMIRRRPDAFWLAVAAVCIGAFMGQLDASIVTVALPTLQRTFHASVGAVTWVGLSYLLVLVATVAAVGRFADMWGHKLLYVYGFGIFIVGSALCGLAPNLGLLIGFRALQAVGAALLQANSVAIIVLAVPKTSLGRAIGIQGAAQAVGLALGPSVGGFLLAAGGWRLIFFVNVPFGLLGMIAGLLLIPRSRHLQARVRFDWTGLALFFPAVVAVFTAISFGNSEGWTSPPIIVLFVMGVALAVGFVRRELRCGEPMLDMALFRRSRFGTGIASSMLAYLVMFGVLFLVPFYLERSLLFGSGRAGLELMTMPLALGVTAPFAGRLADRLGARPPTIAGMATVAGALAALGALRPTTPAFLLLLAVVGIGLGLFIPANNAAIMGSAPKGQSGLASGVLNMTRGMGTALGLALTGLVFDVAGGTSSASPAVARAFTVTALFLAALAVAAGVIAGLRRGGPLERSIHSRVE
ncbi:MAG: DHA2 family efflux MFS transporter permease subunit [Acidimicrobiales bacterium]